MVQEFARLFREHLRSRGYDPRPGADETEIAAFESRHAVRLPDDLREYFRHVNGTAEMPDDWMTKFWSLEDVTSATDRPSGDNRYFVIADQMISAPNFVIALAGPAAPYVFRSWLISDKLEPVGDSFSAFVRLFMEDPATVHFHECAAPF